MNLFGLKISRETLPAEYANSPAESQGGSGGGGAKFDGKIVTAGTVNSCLRVAAYYRAVDIISSSIALMPIQLMTRSKYISAYSPSLSPRGRKLYYLFNVRPNRRTNAFQLKKQAMVAVMNTGNAYIYPVKGDDGEIEELILLSQRANVIDDTDRMEVSFIDDSQNIARDRVPYSDMIIFRNSFCNDSGIGLSTIHYARTALTTALTYTSEGLNRAATGGRMKGIISNSEESSRGLGKYTRGQLNDAKSNLQKQIDSNDDIYVVPQDCKYIPMTMSPADMQFLESEKFGVQEISRFTGCPLALLSEASNSNYKTLADSTNEFYSRTLLPRVSDMQCEMTGKLISPSMAMLQKIQLDPRPIYALDLSAKAAWNKSRLETGVVCPNELRMEEDLPPIEKGEIHYVSTNLAVVGSDKLMYSGKSPLDGIPANEPKEDNL